MRGWPGAGGEPGAVGKRWWWRRLRPATPGTARAPVLGASQHGAFAPYPGIFTSLVAMGKSSP